MKVSFVLYSCGTASRGPMDCLPLSFFITVGASHSWLLFVFILLPFLNHFPSLCSSFLCTVSLLNLSVHPLYVFISSAHISCSIHLLLNPTFLALLFPFLPLLTCCFLCFCYCLYFPYNIPFPASCPLCFPFPSSSHCTYSFLSFFLFFHLGFLSLLYSFHYLCTVSAHIASPLLSAHESQCKQDSHSNIFQFTTMYHSEQTVAQYQGLTV